MARAIDLARGGWGRTFPNPMVGALVVRDGVEVGAGWHAEYGGLHAEVMALAAAGEMARGATIYVTLEPCTHQGKQPPCVTALVAAGIARVVVAARDPNPQAAGGVEQLQARGIQVDVGVHQALASHDNFRFLHRFKSLPRPFVAIKLAVSMDGMIADAAGHSRWLSSPPARDWVQTLRAGFGAIAVGGATAVADESRLTVRGALQPRVAPLRIIFDRRGALRPDHAAFADIATSPLTVITGSAAAESVRDTLRSAGASVIVADDLPSALALLSQGGVDSVLVEGGGRLAGALMRADLVDLVYQIQCPLWLGDGIPAWRGLGTPPLDAIARWQVRNVLALSQHGDVVLELEP